MTCRCAYKRGLSLTVVPYCYMNAYCTYIHKERKWYPSLKKGIFMEKTKEKKGLEKAYKACYQLDFLLSLFATFFPRFSIFFKPPKYNQVQMNTTAKLKTMKAQKIPKFLQ